ncbi:serine proteinase stubble isoform X2 [Polyergus mexicanus]|uniref:serine proteinase stubble isoform X2 n=1 Tax=Polyergus mexicanus TaxID=615972 RepID=UPI0038B41DBD
MRWIGYVATILWWSGIARSLSTLNRGHSYKISPKPCKVPGSESKEGTCMFVWECIKSEGTHVGVCVDTFMFGSCCVHNTTVNTISASHHSHRQQQQQHGDTTTGTLRPILFGSAMSNETTRLTTSTSSLSSWSIGSSTTKPNLYQLSGFHGSTRPLKPYPHGAARPLQKKPHAKPTSEHDVDRLQTPAVSVSASSLNTWTEDMPQETKRPGGHHSHHQKTRPDEGATSEKPLSVQSQPDFKDKLETHNTLIVRLPGKEHADDEIAGSSKPAKPGKPNNLRPFESRPDDGKIGDVDLSVQETINRPNVNSVIENETAKEPHSNLNFIHIERPHWATKPAQSKPSSTDFPKPFFSVKTTTYRPISISGQEDQRPNFISKPNVWALSTKTSTTTTTKSIYVKQPSTSWTPPRPSLKPHWTDSSALFQNGSESFLSRPSFKPTESQQSTEYQKPLGSAHYITTSHLETSTRPRPTKKTTMLNTTSPITLMSSITIHTTINPTTAMTTVTIAESNTVNASTTNAVTTQKSTDREKATVASEKGTGSVMTVAAADESKNMQCGIPPLFPRPETRIVGGKDAPFGRWPWQVSVRRTSFFGFSSTHRCGGAVLNENWIATAGHCVDDLLTSQIRIRVGEYDFSSVQERLPYVERGVAKKVVHPKYNFFTYEYDLALVRLESSLTFAAHISPICLPATDDLLIGENATVTGWGRLSEGGTLPSVLQEVSVPIVSNDRCKSMFLRAGRHEFIPDIFLCAGYETGGQDSCQGDSGGPLQVRGKDGRYFLAGIISWGIGCAEANLPGVCTRISKFVPWILKNVT